jgi:hypothetical protein
MVSGMAAAAELARRTWGGGAVEAVRSGDGAPIGFSLELTPTAFLVVGSDSIRVIGDDGGVIHEQQGVTRGTSIEVCGAAASVAVDFWRELEAGLGRADDEAGILAVLGPELGPDAAGSPLDPRLVHLVVRLHSERALAFQSTVWGEDPGPVDPARPGAEEAVVIGAPAAGSEEAFHLPIAPLGADDPVWRRAAEVGAEAGRAWRRDHAPGDDAGLDAVVVERARAAFRLPIRRWMIAGWSSLVLVPVGVFAIAMAAYGIAESRPGRVPVAVVVGILLFAFLAVLIVLLYRSALRDYRQRRDARQWAVQVAVHRAHEAARTWRTSRVRWSARDLE